MPQPKQKAKDMKTCQIWVAAETENKPAKVIKAPRSIVGRVPRYF